MSWAGTALPKFRVPVGAPLAFAAGILLLAGTIHICTILLVPAVARADGWSRLAAFAGEDRFAEIPVVGAAENVAGLDPLFVNGACRVELGESPAGISVEARDRFWSLALYDRRGTIVFSLNDRTAVEGRLDMLVVNPAQNVELKKSMPDQLQQSIVVEGPSNDLIALLRLFAPTAASQMEARRIIAQAECLPEPLASAAPSG
jgi:uncharacterized membrane protein